MNAMVHALLIDGQWRPASHPSGVFHAFDPTLGRELGDAAYPISTWQDLDSLLDAGRRASLAMARLDPARIAEFLERCADAIEARADLLVETAHRETGLAKEPRLRNVELPRTTAQLRQAARAACDAGWRRPTLDTRANIRSILEPLHAPVLVLGPNNFPFAFNAVSGGDFAAAIAAGNAVIAKAHPAHPKTSALLAEAATECVIAAGLPPGAVQMFFHTSNELGLRLVGDGRIGATAFTGSRAAGMALKSAADRAGRPIYLEMSSCNPVFILTGALRERGSAIASELQVSCALGSGQFCTRPGIAIVATSVERDAFVSELSALTTGAKPGVLLTPQAPAQIAEVVAELIAAGAELLAGGTRAAGVVGYAFAPTLLRVRAEQFLKHVERFQVDAFGPLCLLVCPDDDEELLAVAEVLEGNLTGTIYSDTVGADDPFYALLEPVLRRRVGRLINDRMPTGVAVSPAMNHGGPYPATAHAGFTAVGIPASLTRFAALRCYDNVREARLPAALRNANPSASLMRSVDGELTTRDVD